MELIMNLSEIKSERFQKLVSDCLYNNENMFIAEENAIINTGSDCENHIYTIVPKKAIDITITDRHEECDKDYPYAVLFYINEDDFGAVCVYSNFIDVITDDLFKDIFKED